MRDGGVDGNEKVEHRDDRGGVGEILEFWPSDDAVVAQRSRHPAR